MGLLESLKVKRNINRIKDAETPQKRLATEREILEAAGNTDNSAEEP